MPLEAPNLDDRQFEELLRDARLRIPRYCPDWTDFNDSDPGMALVQLFAWLTEMMLYRMNQVPERNYIKFLQLLNLDREPAKPATTHVCFTLSEGAPVTPVPIRTKFEVAGAAGGDTLIFETTEALDLVPYPLAKVLVQDGINVDDNTAVNEQGTESFRPLGWSPQVGNALYLGLKPADVEVEKNREAQFPERIVLRIFKRPEAPSPKPLVATPGPTLTSAQKLIVWEYPSKLDQAADGSLDRWRPLTVLSDESLEFAREGTLVLQAPRADILPRRGPNAADDDEPLYWIRARMAQELSSRDRIPEIAFIRHNVIRVENLATFVEETLGESDGFQQTYQLRHFPVAPDLELATEDMNGERESWERKNDFLASGPGDAHFTLQASSGTVAFGDGVRGRIPPPRTLVIAKSYRAGGGAAGNVKANAISSPPAGIGQIEQVTNPRAATGGTNEETVDQLKERAPQVLRGDSRAVTADDYRRFAEAVQGVAKATVLPRRHPDYPDFDIPGAVTVLIVPEDLGPKPQPTQELLDRTARELDKRRTLATELFVRGPRYKDVVVNVRVRPEVAASESLAKEAIKKAIEDYLAPVRLADTEPPPPRSPGAAPACKKPQPFPQGWPFREVFHPSRLYEIILSATDATGRVKLIRAVSGLTVNGADLPEVAFEADELPACTATVEIDSSRSEGE